MCYCKDKKNGCFFLSMHKLNTTCISCTHQLCLKSQTYFWFCWISLFIPQIIIYDGILQIRLEWRWHFEVTVVDSFQKRVCGYCGDMNGNPLNDMIIGPYCAPTLDEGTVVSSRQSIESNTERHSPFVLLSFSVCTNMPDTMLKYFHVEGLPLI